MNPAFEGVVGHQRVLELLDTEVDAPAQAYLFVGAAGVGKATVARRFTAALLCAQQGRHDQPCLSCRKLDRGNHPDLVMVEPEGSRNLGVDQARATVAQAVLSPVESARKVFLFEEAGAMTEQAANALLKTLEEPTGSTTFILVTESEDDLPSTVASRCRTVHFGRVDEAALAAALTARGVEPAQAETLARVAGGRPGLALALLANPQVQEFRRAWLAVPLQVSSRPGDGVRLAAEMLATVDPLVEGVGEKAEGEDRASKERRERELRRARQALLATGLEILASFYTDSAALQLGGGVRNRDLPLQVLTDVPPGQAVRSAELALEAVVDLQANLRPQLVLSTLFVRLAGEE